MTNITTPNQNGNNCKTIENFKCKVLNDKTTATTVIHVKSKTVEAKSSKLSARLRILSPERNIPQTLLPPMNNTNGNNGSIISTKPSTIDMPKVGRILNGREENDNLIIRVFSRNYIFCSRRPRILEES